MVKNKRIQKIIAEVVEKIKKEYQPEKIILYGSYAYGKPTRDSDIDLFIVKDTDKRWVDRFVEVSRLIYKHGRHISIEPMVYTPHEVEERLAMGDDFVEDVLTKGEVLYAR
ncbi:MAG: nucleotidyltransferase domain-containing protein [Chloroflexi bacterium]|nr:nucleotidyltransferase domain-containing protein [Chloroflexota bacterium]